MQQLFDMLLRSVQVLLTQRLARLALQNEDPDDPGEKLALHPEDGPHN